MRRIEGVLLHPTRAVFIASTTGKVETLARQVPGVQSHRRGTYDFDSREPCEQCASLERRVTALREELDEPRRRHDLEVREFQRQRLAHEAEARELVEQLAEFIDLVERP